MMTPYQCIAANIRQFRTIPKGSLLWVDIPQHDLFLSVLDIDADNLIDLVGHDAMVKVHLDTPEGDFEDVFEFPVMRFKEPELPVKPKEQSNRDKVVQLHGEATIERVEATVNEYATSLMREYRLLYNFQGNDPIVRTKWHTAHSWGGSRDITISPNYLYENEGEYGFSYNFREYYHIDRDPDIGSFPSIDRLDHVKALVAHELAHFLQRHIRQCVGLPTLDYNKAHGEGWQFLYGVLRRELNQRLNE
ncbi:hypothetical protein ACPENL_003249 [Yersinia enterocolitica]